MPTSIGVFITWNKSSEFRDDGCSLLGVQLQHGFDEFYSVRHVGLPRAIGVSGNLLHAPAGLDERDEFGFISNAQALHEHVRNIDLRPGPSHRLTEQPQRRAVAGVYAFDHAIAPEAPATGYRMREQIATHLVWLKS